jgi:hypothetical protein
MVFDDDRQEFSPIGEVPLNSSTFPSGHAFKHADNGIEYAYFASPYPLTRVRATAEAYRDMGAYESYTCLMPGTTLADAKVDRDDAGRIRYAWRKNAPALGPAEEPKLISSGAIKKDEARWQFQDRNTGKPVRPHAGSVYWNAFRKRWVMIFTQTFGTSFLGEVWYAEAETPVGPWHQAVKICSHDRYSFYNPKQHPMFDRDGGRVIYFEGTYSHTFSGNAVPTPRYDYNQVMYRLDLSDIGATPAAKP